MLNSSIPVAGICDEMIIGLISLLSDLVRVIGSGTGILLSFSIICDKPIKEKKGNKCFDSYSLFYILIMKYLGISYIIIHVGIDQHQSSYN